MIHKRKKCCQNKICQNEICQNEICQNKICQNKMKQTNKGIGKEIFNKSKRKKKEKKDCVDGSKQVKIR